MIDLVRVKTHKGFYSQEDVIEIVEYAQSRFITVIPEIEMPGHSSAALAAYPEFGCNDGPFEVSKEWDIHKNLYCPTEQTFRFLEDVLTEVMELFPGPYIHIGGDEAVKDQWHNSQFCQELILSKDLQDEYGLQSYFIKRMDAFLNSKGKKLIGWDEILEGGLSSNATVMSWHGMKGGVEAVRQGHDVVMTPTSHCYFDYYQSSDINNEPLAIGGMLPVEKVYQFEPVPRGSNTKEASHILGAQGNLWTEYIPTFEHALYMTLPRLTALAEVVWSEKSARDWNNFHDRLQTAFQRYDMLGIVYARHLVEKKKHK